MQPTLPSSTDPSDGASAGETGFSVRAWRLEPPAAGHRPMSAVLVGFSESSYSPSLFESHRIACPEVIRHSGRKRQAEFFFGRWAARRALGLGQPEIEIGIGAHREPVWPAGVTGSISHADDIAVACVCHRDSARGVGIDIERIPSSQVLHEIEPLTLNAAEKAYLHQLDLAHPDLPPGLLHTVLFSVKESVFKALSLSLGWPLHFKDMELTAIDLQHKRIELKVNQALAADRVPADLRSARLAASFELLNDAVVLTWFSWH